MEPFIESLKSNVQNDLTSKVIAFCQTLAEQANGKFTAEDLIKVWNETVDLFIDPALLKTKVVVPVPSSVSGPGAGLAGVPPPPAPGGCAYIFKRGQNKDCACGKKTFAGSFCKTHYKGDASGGSAVSAVSAANAAVAAAPAAPSSGASGASAVSQAGAGGVTAEQVRNAPNVTALKALAQIMKHKGYSKFSKDTVEVLRKELLAVLEK